MVFSSISFLGFFLPTVIIAYYALPQRTYRNSILLISSLVFYAWSEPKRIVLLLIASIIFNYNMGLLIAQKEKIKKNLLFFSIAINLAILFVFKYLGFSNQIINSLISSLHLKPLEIINLTLPIGISFYTFQEISYLVDVYKTPSLVQKNVMNLGLYISFFPQLIAGPIVRYSDINKQIYSRTESIEKAFYGAQRFIIGLSKKVLLANNLALTCDSIYNDNFFSYGMFAAWIAAIAYALQIYYDFSGYSDMAIGLGKIFGFEIRENFNYPYAASSITDFWKRWHISLTNFFRDYVYIPLGGNRKGTKKTLLNRLTVFFLTGLWHGAAFNFIFWGLLHGVSMVLERQLDFKRKKSKIISIFQRFVSLFLIILLWVLFRNGTEQTIKIWLKMFGINYTTFYSLHEISPTPLFWYSVDTKFFFILLFSILFSIPWWKKIELKCQSEKKITNITSIIKCVILLLLFLMSIAALANNTYNPFIYFRF